MTYRLEAVSRTPKASGAPDIATIDPIFFSGVSVEQPIKGYGSIQFSTRVETLTEELKFRMRDLFSFPTEVVLYDGSELIESGIITSVTVQNGTASIYAHGLGYYLNYMYINSDQNFSQVDQFTIGKWFVDQWQSLSWGNFGITTNVGTSGVLRDRNGYYKREENQQVVQMLNNLSEVINGFDWAVLPNRALKFWYPQRGIDRSNDVFLDRRNTAEDTTVISVQHGDSASVGMGVGSNSSSDSEVPVRTSTRVNTAAMQKFGRAAIAETFDGVSVQSTLDGYTDKLLQERTKILLKPSGSFIPVSGATRKDFESGDYVTYSYDYGFGLYTGVHRVLSRRIGIDDANNESLSVELA